MAGLYGAMFGAVSGLEAQNENIAARSSNIAASGATASKAVDVRFQTLVAGTGNITSGVKTSARTLVDIQGDLQATGRLTDIALDSRGMFVANTKADGSGDFVFTRDGAFAPDANGYFYNPGTSLYLFAWQLDGSGNLPASVDTLQTLKAVNLSSYENVANATSNIKLGLNLKETQSTYAGNGNTITFSNAASNNYQITATDVIDLEDYNATNDVLNSGDQITVTPGSVGSTYTFTYDGTPGTSNGIIRGKDITAGIFGASTATSLFTGATNGDGFTITLNGNTHSFTYNTTPDIASGEFNTLASLAESISLANGLTSRVSKDGKTLLIAPVDGTKALTVAKIIGSTVDFTSGAVGLGLASTTAQAGRFTTLQGLADLVNQSSGVKATVSSIGGLTDLQINATDPTGTIVFDTITGGLTNSGVASTATKIFTALGFSGTHGSTLLATYSPALSTANMANGAVTPHFTQTVSVYDAFGNPHNLTIGFLNKGLKSWAVEVYAPSADIANGVNGGEQLAYGDITFNGDGTPNSVSPALSNAITLQWNNGAINSSITLDWGTTGATSIAKLDGITQLAADYMTSFVNQDGSAVGSISQTTISKDGKVILNYNTGAMKAAYQIAIADFSNINALDPRSGNAYTQSIASGSYILKQAGEGGVGGVVAGTLEQSNIDISNEMVSLIVAQRGYQANTQMIKIANSLLEDLNRILT